MTYKSSMISRAHHHATHPLHHSLTHSLTHSPMTFPLRISMFKPQQRLGNEVLHSIFPSRGVDFAASVRVDLIDHFSVRNHKKLH
jgi:hypothetical protein